MTRMGIGSMVGKRVAPRIQRAAPNVSSGFVRETLRRAINGIGPLPPATEAARKKLDDEHGDVDRAVRAVVSRHVKYAGAQGFVTNIGGLLTAVVTLPANVAGLAAIQCRMVAAIAHLRGFDLDDPRVRNAIIACLIDEDEVPKLVKRKRLPDTPHGLAHAPSYDPEVERTVAAEVAAELIARATGRRLATMVGRRMPIIGGVVGMGADGWSTWQVGRYAARELRRQP
jgi:uncharacterized protein (DUF697 family)